MKFDIRHVKNGAVLTAWMTAEESGERDEIVYQEKYHSDEGDDIDAFADFLSLVCDHYGPTTSRTSAKRIYIRVEPGDKHEPPA